jgi:hypothetical protein
MIYKINSIKIKEVPQLSNSKINNEKFKLNLNLTIKNKMNELYKNN